MGFEHVGSPDLSHDAEVTGHVPGIGRVLRRQEGEIYREITHLLGRQIDLLESAPDSYLYELLEASVAGNIDAILYMLEQDVPLARVQPPTAAIDYAIRLAQRGVPPHSLMRAYHMGQDDLMRHVFAAAQQIDISPELKFRLVDHVSALIYRYIDWMVQRALEAYEVERQRWLNAAGNLRASAVHGLLAGENVSESRFAAQTGYSLAQQHVGCHVRYAATSDHGDELMTVERMVAQLCEGRPTPLVVAIDRASAWVWLPRGRDDSPVDVDRARQVATRFPECEIAFGAAAYGIEGFRRTHDQATATSALLRSGGSVENRVVAYSEPGVAVVSVLARDLAITRDWVRDVLGPLAVDDPATEELRHTLRIYLLEGQSYAKAAERLHLHRNSVKYRIGKALGDRPQALGEARIDLAVALQACFYLGNAALQPRS